jgi:four helix bundle protein
VGKAGQDVSGGVKRFEDLIAWQRARSLTREIYQVTGSHSLGADYGLSRQMQRAAVSIMANVAEGFERRSIGEFRRFIVIAKASCAELRSHLYVAVDVGYLNSAIAKQLIDRTEEVSRILYGLHNAIDRRS